MKGHVTSHTPGRPDYGRDVLAVGEHQLTPLQNLASIYLVLARRVVTHLPEVVMWH